MINLRRASKNIVENIKRCTCEDIPEGTIHKLASVLVEDCKTIVVKKKGVEEFISLGGKHEGAETIEACLQREALEELGIVVANPQFLGRYQDLTVDSGVPIILDAYLVEARGDFRPQAEILEFLWVDRDYENQGIKLASILRIGIIPELINRGLL